MGVPFPHLLSFWSAGRLLGAGGWRTAKPWAMMEPQDGKSHGMGEATGWEKPQDGRSLNDCVEQNLPYQAELECRGKKRLNYVLLDASEIWGYLFWQSVSPALPSLTFGCRELAEAAVPGFQVVSKNRPSNHGEGDRYFCLSL